MADLSNDEVSCLTIMAGSDMGPPQNMLAIGRWREPIEKLAAQGYARKLDQFNYVATPAGKELIENYDKSQSDDFLRIHKQVADVRKKAVDLLKESARNLAEASKAQHELTGELPNQAAYNLGQDVIRLALEMLK